MLTSLASLCHHLSDFTAERGYRFKAMPVIAMEFAGVNDFFGAFNDLLRAHIEHQNMSACAAPPVRRVDANTVELDMMGCVFRLKCVSYVDTPRGPMGIAELINSPIVVHRPKP